jgi:hypothetical protein
MIAQGRRLNLQKGFKDNGLLHLTAVSLAMTTFLYYFFTIVSGLNLLIPSPLAGEGQGEDSLAP